MTTFGAIRTARIGHECAVCPQPIRPGQVYREWRVPPGDLEEANEHWFLARLHMPGECSPPAGAA